MRIVVDSDQPNRSLVLGIKAMGEFAAGTTGDIQDRHVARPPIEFLQQELVHSSHPTTDGSGQGGRQEVPIEVATQPAGPCHAVVDGRRAFQNHPDSPEVSPAPDA